MTRLTAGDLLAAGCRLNAAWPPSHASCVAVEAVVKVSSGCLLGQGRRQGKLAGAVSRLSSALCHWACPGCRFMAVDTGYRRRRVGRRCCDLPCAGLGRAAALPRRVGPSSVGRRCWLPSGLVGRGTQPGAAAGPATAERYFYHLGSLHQLTGGRRLSI